MDRQNHRIHGTYSVMEYDKMEENRTNTTRPIYLAFDSTTSRQIIERHAQMGSFSLCVLLQADKEIIEREKEKEKQSGRVANFIAFVSNTRLIWRHDTNTS